MYRAIPFSLQMTDTTAVVTPDEEGGTEAGVARQLESSAEGENGAALGSSGDSAKETEQS